MLGAIIIFILLLVFVIASTFLKTPPSEVRDIQHVIDPQISQITPDVYITNVLGASNYNALRSLGITQILTVGSELSRHTDPRFKTMYIKIADDSDENIKKYFNSTFNFIKRGRTVVHCAAGKSRSVTIVAAYLMRLNGWTSDQALSHIWERRNIINPNPGFKEQLKKFEEEMKGSSINKTKADPE